MPLVLCSFHKLTPLSPLELHSLGTLSPYLQVDVPAGHTEHSKGVCVEGGEGGGWMDLGGN